MEDFSGDLRVLAKTRIFALSAILFFVFLTVFVVILLSSQSKNTGEQARTANETSASNPYFQSQKKTAVPIQTDAMSNQKQDGSSSSDSSAQSSGSQETSQKKELERITKTALPLPKVSVSSYEVKASLPTLPEKVNIYTFKTNYSDEEVAAFADRLGVVPSLVDRGQNKVTLTDLDGNVLSFDKATGSFAFSSDLGTAVSTPSKNPAQNAANFLKEAGLADSTLIYTAAYASPASPGSTFVEFHRDWKKVGFPIIDILGLYNLPPSRSLKTLQLGEVDLNAPKGSRPNHFNTMTVEVDNTTGRIKSATSSLRRIAEIKSVSSSILKTPAEALSEIQNGQAAFTLSIPTGAGFVDLQKMYPSNTATAQKVTITDVAAAYWENNPNTNQTELNLFYVACGNTTLSSGYGSRICQVVPVVKGTTMSVLGESTSVAQASGPLNNPLPTQIGNQESSSIKYDTFGFEGTKTESCPQTFTNSYKVGPGEYIAWQDAPAPRPRSWYLVLTNESSEAIQTDTSGRLTNDEKARAILLRSQAWRKCTPRLPKVCAGAPNEATVRGCYFIMTASPSLYLYTPQKTNVSVAVSPEGGISYQNPAYNNGLSWKTAVSPDGTLSLDTGNTDHLYYEFNKQVLAPKLTANQSGYIVAASSLPKLVKQISVSLKLTEREAQNWVQEVARDTAQISSDYVKVSFVDPAALNTYLPLAISPRPAVIHRLMLRITPAAANSTATAPLLSPLPRSGFTVIETGVIVTD